MTEKKLKFILVEDSEYDAELLLIHLKKAGYQLDYRLVQTEAEFMEALAEESWPLIIADYSMPSFGAKPALKLLQSTGLDIPFIVVSGTIGEEVAVEMMRLGAHDYVMKGALNRLPMAIERELREAELRQAGRENIIALRESNERHQIISDLVSDYTYAFTLDPDGTLHLKWGSGAYEAITGISLDHFASLEEWYAMIHPDDLAAFKERDANYLLKKDHVFEFRLINRRNELHWLREFSRPVWNEKEGRVTELYGAIQDITDQKLAQIALQETQQLLSSAANATSANIAILDRDGSIIAVNKAWRKFVDENIPNHGQYFIGQHYIEFFRASNLIINEKTIFDQIRAVLSDKIPQFEVEYPEDGKTGKRWFHLNINAIQNSGTAKAVLVYVDITERKASEEEIRSRAAHQEALNSIITSSYENATHMDVFLQSALDQTLHALGLTIGAIWLVPQRGHPVQSIVRGVPATQITEIVRFANPKSLEFKKITLIQQDDKNQSILNELSHLFGAKAMLAVPLFSNSVQIGGIGFISPQDYHWTSREIKLLEAISQHIGIALERVWLFEEANHRLNELLSINHLSTALRAATNLKDMLQLFLIELDAVARSSASTIWLYNAATGYLEAAAAKGWMKTLENEILSPGEDISGYTFTSQRPYVIDDYKSDPRTKTSFRNQIPKGWSGICLPIQTSTNEVMGVLTLVVESKYSLSVEDVRLIGTFSEIAAVTIQRMRLTDQLIRRVEQLNSLHEIDLTVNANIDLNASLDVMLNLICRNVGIDAIALLSYQPTTQQLTFTASQGFTTSDLQWTRFNLDKSVAGRSILEHKITLIENVDEVDDFKKSSFIAREKFVSYLAVPLFAKGKIKGVLQLFNRTQITPDPEWLKFLETIAGQLAIGMDNAELVEALQHSNIELTQAYDATIEGWSRAMDLRDKETEGHTQRVTELTLTLAREMGVEESELIHYWRGALLHDMGKMGIPDQILLKPGKLSDEEWVIMRKHPQYTYEMLSPIEFLQPALDIPYSHHEKWDGSGYPRGLKGEDIPLAARIFAVIDVWDALTSDRPYRPAWTQQEALEHIATAAGTHFDPAVVELFLKIFDTKNQK